VDSDTLPETTKCEENRERSPHYGFLYIRSHESGLNCLLLISTWHHHGMLCAMNLNTHRVQITRIETVLRKV